MLKKLYIKYEEIIKYIIMGILATVISIGSYAVFKEIIGINYLISNVFSWICAVSFAFITNKIIVFRSNATGITFLKETIYFFIARLLTLGLETLMMYILVDLFKINDLLVKIIAQIVVVVSNYVISKVFVFNNEEKKSERKNSDKNC